MLFSLIFNRSYIEKKSQATLTNDLNKPAIADDEVVDSGFSLSSAKQIAKQQNITKRKTRTKFMTLLFRRTKYD